MVGLEGGFKRVSRDIDLLGEILKVVGLDGVAVFKVAARKLVRVKDRLVIDEVTSRFLWILRIS